MQTEMTAQPAQPKYAMVPIPRWNQDANGLQWYAGFYLPVPIDAAERAKYIAGFAQDTKAVIEKYVAAHPAEFQVVPQAAK